MSHDLLHFLESASINLDEPKYLVSQPTYLECIIGYTCIPVSIMVPTLANVHVHLNLLGIFPREGTAEFSSPHVCMYHSHDCVDKRYSPVYTIYPCNNHGGLQQSSYYGDKQRGVNNGIMYNSE